MPKKNKKPAQTPKKELPAQESIVPVLLASFGLAIICLIAYFPSLSNGFVDWDDKQYIHESGLVSDLSPGSIRNIFSKYTLANYHPFTVLSLALNYKVSGAEPFSYHLTDLVLHIFNSILVLLVVLRMNQGLLAAGITAALFAVHPMHVESVAWASERKDVLYTFFFLCSFLSYLKYISTGNFRLIALALVLFIFSCLSKGMAVTLPLIMFAADYALGRKNYKKIIMEKIPFLFVSLVFGVVAVAGQHHGEAIATYHEHGFVDRILLSIYGFAFYLYKMIIPTGFSALYPYPIKAGNWFPPMVYVSLLVLFIYTALALCTIRRQKFVFFGLSFFVLSILPVLQLLPVGDAVAADRYFYVSSIGLFFLAGEVLEKSVKKYGKRFAYLNPSIILIFLTIIGGLTYLSNQQSRVWKNDVTLFTQAARVQPLSPMAHGKLGLAHQIDGRIDQAMECYRKALALTRRSSILLTNMGQCYVSKEEYALSIPYFQESIDLKPNDPLTWYNMGNAHGFLGNYKEAIRDFTIAIEQNKNYFNAYNNRAAAFLAIGESEKGLQDMRIAAQGGQANAIQFLKGLEGK
jgi:tetratricopeptide (TPR) repeat protein